MKYMSNRQKRKLIREAVKYILDFLAEGDHITIRGFGTFKVTDRKERKIRNIRTGQIITIPPYTTVVFKASKKLRNYFPPVSWNVRNSKSIPKNLELSIPQEEIDKAYEEAMRMDKREEEKKAKEFRKYVLRLGGIKDKDWESIPRWAKRIKTGRTLREVADELNYFAPHLAPDGGWNEETLYDALWDHTMALR